MTFFLKKIKTLCAKKSPLNLGLSDIELNDKQKFNQFNLQINLKFLKDQSVNLFVYSSLRN